MFALRTCANIVSFLLVTKNEIGAERLSRSGRPLGNAAYMYEGSATSRRQLGTRGACGRGAWQASGGP